MESLLARIVACALLVAASAAVAMASAGAAKIIYVDDIDAWRVEIFAGSANPGGLLEGPALEAGIGRGGSMCFLPSGEACLASGGVILLISRDHVFRLLAGLPGMCGAPMWPGLRTARRTSATPTIWRIGSLSSA